MTAFAKMLDHQRQTQILLQVAMRLGWDQETMMPKGAAHQRAEEMAALEMVLHARRTDPAFVDLLDRAEPASDIDAAQLRDIKRQTRRAMAVPADLAAEIARVTSRAQGIWAEARANEDVTAFLPVLGQVIDLRRQEAQAIAGGGDPYDALLQDYEPGITGADIAALFDRMRPRLTRLRDRLLAADPAPQIRGRFLQSAQLNLSAQLADVFGYDLTRGRVDLAVHPFSSGSGDDVRITTRVDESDPLGCLYSTIHEIGHACYEQNVDPAYAFSILGQGASMGVHESQSRIYENQLGRAPAFAGWLYTQMTAAFGDIGLSGADAFAKAVNAVRPGFIRTESDEVQYNLHIMMRFDLERALISGDLAVADLESAWNDRFTRDFGQMVDKPSDGMLQDVHWSVGLFGYFPTYALGNIYAGCLHQAMARDLPDLDADLAQGQLTRATQWLKDKLQRHGARFVPQDTISQAIGGPVDEGALLDYLDDKYTKLYNL